MHQFDISSKNLYAISKKMGELNMILMIHSLTFYDMSMPGKLFKLAADNPKTRFIFAHTGGMQFLDYSSLPTQKHVGGANNVWLELSFLLIEANNSPFIEQLSWFVKHVGVDRVLFSSDYPSSIETSIDTIYKLNLTLEDQENIFYKNAYNLINN